MYLLARFHLLDGVDHSICHIFDLFGSEWMQRQVREPMGRKRSYSSCRKLSGSGMPGIWHSLPLLYAVYSVSTGSDLPRL